MAWNEPGNDKDKNGQDPWGNRNRGQGEPPDLEQVIKKLWQRLSGGRSGSGGGRSQGSGTGKEGTVLLGVLLGLAAALYIGLGFFIVKPAERAAIFRFGKYVRTVDSGWHWIPRVIERKIVLNVQQVSVSHHRGEMLTKDDVIVYMALNVQYRIGNIQQYLFNVVNPNHTLSEATDSAMRQVVGHSTLNQILTSGRALIRQQILAQLRKILDTYQAGVLVLDITVQEAKPPEAVREAFADAIKAEEDEKAFINLAVAYSRRVVPQAEGVAKRILAEADAYKQQVLLKAQGDVAGFLKILPVYLQAPSVTRKQIYLETLQNVFAHANKIVIDTKQSSNLLYLPVDKLIDQRTRTMAVAKQNEVEGKAAANSELSVRQVISQEQPQDYSEETSDTGRYRSSRTERGE